jgi:hypothetical protein
MLCARGFVRGSIRLPSVLFSSNSCDPCLWFLLLTILGIPFTAQTRVRIPPGTPINSTTSTRFRKDSLAQRGLLILLYYCRKLTPAHSHAFRPIASARVVLSSMKFPDRVVELSPEVDCKNFDLRSQLQWRLAGDRKRLRKTVVAWNLFQLDSVILRAYHNYPQRLFAHYPLRERRFSLGLAKSK